MYCTSHIALHHKLRIQHYHDIFSFVCSYMPVTRERNLVFVRVIWRLYNSTNSSVNVLVTTICLYWKGSIKETILNTLIFHEHTKVKQTSELKISSHTITDNWYYVAISKWIKGIFSTFLGNYFFFFFCLLNLNIMISIQFQLGIYVYSTIFQIFYSQSTSQITCLYQEQYHSRPFVSSHYKTDHTRKLSTTHLPSSTDLCSTKSYIAVKPELNSMLSVVKVTKRYWLLTWTGPGNLLPQ